MRLKKLKQDAENYLNQLENTPKSVDVFDEMIKTIEILKKVNRDIEKYQNN